MRAHATAALAVLLVLAGCAGVGPLPDASNAGAPTASGPSAGGDAVTVHVTRVVDGDTIDVTYANGTSDTVRLVGIDTPETHAENTPSEFTGVPETDAGRACLGRWGEEASAFATARLADRNVTLTFDPNTDRRGYYGRLLAYVSVGNTTYNYAAVAEGYARVYTDSEFSREDAYVRAADDARAANRGLWTCRTPATDGGTDTGRTDTGGTTTSDATTTTAADGGSASAALAVRVHADADGPDGENLNDEYVVLTNTGDSALAMGGWTVTDAADHTYTLPDEFTLPAGDAVTVHTGRGTDTASDLYWAAGSPLWNNDGDTVTVRAANGTRVAEHTYPG